MMKLNWKNYLKIPKDYTDVSFSMSIHIKLYSEPSIITNENIKFTQKVNFNPYQ